MGAFSGHEICLRVSTSQEKLGYDQVKNTGRFYLEHFQITTYIPTKETDLSFQK